MSAGAFRVDDHFASKDPSVRAIYDRLLEVAGRLGSYVEDPKKTSIHLNRKTAFAGVATRKGAIVLTVKSDRAIKSPRIFKSEQTSASRWHHEIKLTSPDDVDAELATWLGEAYGLSG